MFARLAVTAFVVSACDLSTESTDGFPPTPASQGIVAGFVRDTAGQAVASAIVCAMAAFDASGTPAMVVGQGSTNSTGAYVVHLNLTFKADARAGLTVAATPAAASGLTPAYIPYLSLLVSSTPPPPETTRTNLEVTPGPAHDGVFCVYGG